MTENPIFNIQS